MEYFLLLVFAFGIPWVLPRIYPTGYAKVGIAICLASVFLLFALAGEKDAQQYQIIIMGLVIGAFLACRRGLNKDKSNG